MEIKRYAKAWGRNILGKPNPMILFFHVTPRCNLKCRFCNVWRDQREYQPTLEEVEERLVQGTELDIPLVSFSGGEPLLREDIGKMLESGKELGYTTSLTTNGVLLADKIEEISENVDELGVSLDSPIPAEHDHLRGVEGTYEKAIEGIRKAIEVGLKPTIHMILTRKSKEHAEKMVELSKELGTKLRISQMLVQPYEGQDESDKGLMLENSEYTSKVRELNDQNGTRVQDSYYIDLVESGGNKTENPVCKSCSTTMTIMPDNKVVFPCSYRPKFRFDGELKEVWESEDAERIRENCGRWCFCEGCTSHCYLTPSLAASSEFPKVLWGLKDKVRELL